MKCRLASTRIIDNSIAWFPVIAYCSLIFYLSSGPVKAKALSIQHLDKVIHTGEYLLLSILLSRAFRKSFPGKTDRTIKLITVIVTICYGVSDEMHQSFVPARDADFFDVCFDALGAFLGQKIYFGSIAKNTLYP